MLGLLMNDGGKSERAPFLWASDTDAAHEAEADAEAETAPPYSRASNVSSQGGSAARARRTRATGVWRFSAAAGTRSRRRAAMASYPVGSCHPAASR